MNNKMEEYTKKEENNDTWLTRETVREAKDTRAVIIGGGHWKEFTYDDDGKSVTVEKPAIIVSLDGKHYEWTMAKTAARNLTKDLGVDMDSWSGAVVKLFEDGNKGYEFVNGLVIDRGRKE